MRQPIVTFVTRALADRWKDVDALGDPGSTPERFRNGVDVWIVQTYLELKACQTQHEFSVEISENFPANQPAIAHRDDLRVGAAYYRSYLADTRADRAATLAAAWHIVQNPTQANAHSILIPHWPQPGLMARDSRRSDIRTLGFFGRLGSTPGFFHDPSFLAELAVRGVSFNLSEQNWCDYRGTDVAVALRFDPEIGSFAKPFSKLVNAWLARVPALLGPEPAYRWLRKSELDYLEVHSARDVLAAVDRLQSTPGLYAAMVENGLVRARDFDRSAVRAAWVRFVESQFVPGWQTWNEHRPPDLRRVFDFGRLLYVQRRERVAYKRLEAAQRAALRASRAGESPRQD